MHPARTFHESDPAILRQRILDHPFALIASVSDGRPLSVHAPVLPCGGGEPPRLRFHLSVANPVTKALLAGTGRVHGPAWLCLPRLVRPRS